MPKLMARQLFLSYSSKDKETAIGLQSDLEDFEWTVWRDEVDIAAGTQWSSAIDTSLRDPAAVVVLVFENSATSAWRRAIPAIGPVSSCGTDTAVSRNRRV